MHIICAIRMSQTHLRFEVFRVCCVPSILYFGYLLLFWVHCHVWKFDCFKYNELRTFPSFLGMSKKGHTKHKHVHPLSLDKLWSEFLTWMVRSGVSETGSMMDGDTLYSLCLVIVWLLKPCLAFGKSWECSVLSRRGWWSMVSPRGSARPMSRNGVALCFRSEKLKDVIWMVD